VPFSGISLVRGLAIFVDKVASLPLSVDAASEDDSDVDSDVGGSDDVRGGDVSVTLTTTSLALTTTEVELTGNNDKNITASNL
jgi:hypothetical protein